MKIRWILLGLVVVGCVWCLGNNSASAAPFLPDSANFTPAGAGGDPWLEVSKADGVNVQLEAPVLWVKVYSTTPNISITFDNIAFCGPDYGAPVDTIFRAFRTTPSENLEFGASGPINLGQQSTGGASSCAGYTLNVGGLTQSTVQGHTNYYVGLIQVVHNGAPGNINRFKMWGNGAELGYWDQGKIEDTSLGTITPVNDAYAPSNPSVSPYAAFGVGSSFAMQSPSTGAQDMTLEFAPGCDLNVNRTAYLKWFDADQGMPNQPGVISFTLDEYDVNGAFVSTQVNTSAVGGDGQFGTAAFTAVPGHRYRWTWRNVAANNGIQLWLPYDSQNYFLRCDTPPGGLLDSAQSTCDTVGGWAVDVDSINTPVSVRVYKDALPAFGGTLVQEVVANQPGPGGVSPYPGGFIPGNHGFTVSISAHRDFTRHNYYATAFNLNKLGQRTGEEVFLSNNPQAVGPCVAPPDCSALQIVASDGSGIPEPGDPFQARLGFTFSGPPPSVPFNYTITPNFAGATGMPPAINGTYPLNGNIQTISNIRQANAGLYNGQWTVSITPSNPQITLNCSGPYTIGAKPYFRAYGNDVSAGGSFATGAATTCATVDQPDATIAAFGRINGGAASQYAAFALGAIETFASAGQRSGKPAPNPWKGLTFANTGLPTYGGNSEIARCIPDYMARFKPDATIPNISALNARNGGLLVNGNVHLNGNSTIDIDQKLALYINGDLLIDTNIAFATAGGPLANRNRIPFLQIVVRGNIYITGTVTQLDGSYIAQGGVIYTCANRSGSTGVPYTAQGIAQPGNCDRKLNVNGAFTARKVELLRTVGTQAQSGINEIASSPTIAEVFNFSPEMYLAIPPEALRGSCSFCEYNAITSLPPVL